MYQRNQNLEEKNRPYPSDSPATAFLQSKRATEDMTETWLETNLAKKPRRVQLAMTARPRKNGNPVTASSREFRRIVEKNLRKDRRLLERLANETGVDLKDSKPVPFKVYIKNSEIDRVLYRRKALARTTSVERRDRSTASPILGKATSRGRQLIRAVMFFPDGGLELRQRFTL